ASAAQVLAHLLESRAVQEPSDRNEADDAFLVLLGMAGRCIVARPEDFPGRPPPEIDVKVPEVLEVRAHAPFRRRAPAIERRNELAARTFLDPAAAAFRLF